MKVTPTRLPEVLIVEPQVFGDDRGFFYESWNAERFAAAGLEADFVQDNHSRSARGVLRGLHYQVGRPQGKLVRVAAGAVFDVAVDLRRSSSSFGSWVGAELDARDKKMLWIPPGFAHGFLSLQEGSEVLYKCTDFYAPEEERTLLWSDPAIGIAWPFPAEAIATSSKDAAGTPLSEAETYT